MELPPVSAKYDQKMRFGAYVAARLRLHKLEELAARVEKRTNRLRDVNHRLDDAAARVHAAMAMRDHWVEGLTKMIHVLRATLDGAPVLRAANLRIFKKGVEHFLNVPLGELEARHLELIGLVEEHLGTQEKLQRKTLKSLRTRLDGFKEATRQMSEARAALFEARGKREKSTKSWQKAMREVYEALSEAVGEEEAEKVYPQVVRMANLDGDDRGGKMGDLRSAFDRARLAAHAQRSKS